MLNESLNEVLVRSSSGSRRVSKRFFKRSYRTGIP